MKLSIICHEKHIYFLLGYGEFGLFDMCASKKMEVFSIFFLRSFSYHLWFSRKLDILHFISEKCHRNPVKYSIHFVYCNSVKLYRSYFHNRFNISARNIIPKVTAFHRSMNIHTSLIEFEIFSKKCSSWCLLPKLLRPFSSAEQTNSLATCQNKIST